MITFNYDDLLEIYLEFHGLVVEPIWRDEHWASNADIRIYHPHGFLPLDPRHGRSDDIEHLGLALAHLVREVDR